MADIFFSKKKNGADDTAGFDNTMFVSGDTADHAQEAEYYRRQYYREEYGINMPASKPYQPPFMADEAEEDIPTYQLPFESETGIPVSKAAQPQQRYAPRQNQGFNYQRAQYQQQPQYQQRQSATAPQYQQAAPQQTYYPPQPEAPKPKKKKRKKRRLLRALISTLLTVVILIGIVVGGAIGGVYYVASNADYNLVELEENQYISASELHSSDDVVNILFLGVDGTEESDSLRSDSMMLISIDSAHKKIKLTSFLRDSWVEIPSKDRMAKLNAAFAYGGAQLAVDTIEYNFLIDIDHYVMVNFDMFTQIIDNLGGVEVEVTEKEADFINRTTRHTIESGESVLLNGAEALVYCRIRKLDTDYMRTFRQRKVISALIERAKDSELTELYETVMDIFPMIQTDMDAKDLTKLFFKAGYALVAFDGIQQTQAPIDEHFEEGYTEGGQWAEFLDLEAVREYLYDFIYTDKIDTEEKEE